MTDGLLPAPAAGPCGLNPAKLPRESLSFWLMGLVGDETLWRGAEAGAGAGAGWLP